MDWYSHLFQNFPQFIVIHTVKGFGIVNKAEIDVFLELSCFFNDPAPALPHHKKYISHMQLDFTGISKSKLPKPLDFPERLEPWEQP